MKYKILAAKTTPAKETTYDVREEVGDSDGFLVLTVVIPRSLIRENMRPVAGKLVRYSADKLGAESASSGIAKPQASDVLTQLALAFKLLERIQPAC